MGAGTDGDDSGLLAWADGHGRDLPWRHTRDPWAVLVSELMLQQTQVVRVVPRWRAFLASFPTPVACAGAPVGDVVRAWSGLGYNRRAVNLHAAATSVVADHGGRLPDDLDRLLALPGVGPYTARAVLAFAFERDVAVVDTNVARILARVAGRSLDRRQVQAAADGAVPAGCGWAWNQAMLDLGATVCTDGLRPVGAVRGPGGAGGRPRVDPEPDPARGSAGVSGGQSPFEGSDRQGRGRLVAALRVEPTIRADRVAEVSGWPDDPARAESVAATLVRDGLAVRSADGSLALP